MISAMPTCQPSQVLLRSRCDPSPLGAEDKITLHSSRLTDPKAPGLPDPKVPGLPDPQHKKQSGPPSLDSGHQPGWLAHLSGSAPFFGGFLPNLRPWSQQNAGAARFGLSRAATSPQDSQGSEACGFLWFCSQCTAPPGSPAKPRPRLPPTPAHKSSASVNSRITAPRHCLAAFDTNCSAECAQLATPY